MAKYHGAIGYAIQTETAPDVWEPVIVERICKGDWFRKQERRQPSGEVNENINIDNELSVVADPYMYDNLEYIVYVTYMGTKWKVQSFMINRPRIVLQLGGVWTG